MFECDELDQHFSTFEQFIACARSFADRRRYNVAAAYAQVAASYAVVNHAGMFVSPTLEKLLLTIGREVADKQYPFQYTHLRDGTPRRVLHVLTLARNVGGHTRMLWRWIQQDRERMHSLVLTRQGNESVPHQLKQAVQQSNGSLHILQQRIGDLVTWGRELRQIASLADLVVLHSHGNDVLPMIAFAQAGFGPPVVYLNHADHMFWVGVSISNLVANQRLSGARLSHERRGIEPHRSALLPVTLNPTPRTVSRSAAKKHLGLPDDCVLLLSVARPSKYETASELGSQVNDLVLPGSLLNVLDRFPNAHLLVVGPEQTGKWEQAGRMTNGRVRALGQRLDTAIYYQAADIYVDSLPFTSITSLLEAGNYELPLVCCYPYSPTSDVLSADTPALTGSVIRAQDADSFNENIACLIQDVDLRERCGEEVRNRIHDVHCGAGWNSYMRGVYLQAATAQSAAAPAADTDHMSITELDRALLSVTRERLAADDLIQSCLRLFPLDIRVKLWLDVGRRHRRFMPGLLLPEWLGVRLVNGFSSAASLHQRAQHES